MDDFYDTFMPYRRKGKTVRGELSTRTVYYVASSSNERGIEKCMKIRNREARTARERGQGRGGCLMENSR